MLSLLSALLSIASAVMKFLDRRSVEEGAKARLILQSWANNDTIVSEALAAGEAMRRKLDTDPGSLREHDENERT